MSKITNNPRLNPVWHRTLYSCTHMATVGIKGLQAKTWYAYCNQLVVEMADRHKGGQTIWTRNASTAFEWCTKTFITSFVSMQATQLTTSQRRHACTPVCHYKTPPLKSLPAANIYRPRNAELRDIYVNETTSTLAICTHTHMISQTFWSRG